MHLTTLPSIVGFAVTVSAQTMTLQQALASENTTLSTLNGLSPRPLSFTLRASYPTPHPLNPPPFSHLPQIQPDQNIPHLYIIGIGWLTTHRTPS